MKESNIVSAVFIAIGVSVIAYLLFCKHQEGVICENIHEKAEGRVYCKRCGRYEPIRKVFLDVDGKTPEGETFQFARIYTFEHEEPFEAFAKRDGPVITSMQVGCLPGAMYDNDTE